MARMKYLLTLVCAMAALTLLAASPSLTAPAAQPPAETVEMRLLPDDRPIRVTGDGRVIELRAPAAEQLPSFGFDATLMPVYDTAEPVKIAKMPVAPDGGEGPGAPCLEEGAAACAG